VINGALPADAGILGFMKEIGLTVDHGFDPSGLSDGEKKSLAQAMFENTPSEAYYPSIYVDMDELRTHLRLTRLTSKSLL
jgi:hypothetical protein